MNLDGNEVTRAVGGRYASGAQAVEADLCCPVSYDGRYLGVLPAEILERDYGCGDPSRYVRPGETVLDLGSGGGKICYIASQVVGPEGRVIGVDMTPEMLGLARRHQHAVARRIGWDNVVFHRGRIEDLRLDLDRLDEWLATHPVGDTDGYDALQAVIERLRRDEPMIADDSIDTVLSNCVLNLVAPARKRLLFEEIYRVLVSGGRAVISDIVADRAVPRVLQEDPALWSGCLSGALEEEAFLRAFEAAGFHGIEVMARQEDPWRVVEGVEFRSLTIAAHKGKEGPCVDAGQSLVYRGPFRCVEDDDGHTFLRGRREAVCEKTFALLGREPYRGMFTRLSEDGLAERDLDRKCRSQDEGPCC